ncbi:unnamed protein product [Caretta caretta]
MKAKRGVRETGIQNSTKRSDMLVRIMVWLVLPTRYRRRNASSIEEDVKHGCLQVLGLLVDVLLGERRHHRFLNIEVDGGRGKPGWKALSRVELAEERKWEAEEAGDTPEWVGKMDKERSLIQQQESMSKSERHEDSHEHVAKFFNILTKMKASIEAQANNFQWYNSEENHQKLHPTVTVSPIMA